MTRGGRGARTQAPGPGAALLVHGDLRGRPGTWAGTGLFTWLEGGVGVAALSGHGAWGDLGPLCLGLWQGGSVGHPCQGTCGVPFRLCGQACVHRGPV